MQSLGAEPQYRSGGPHLPNRKRVTGEHDHQEPANFHLRQVLAILQVARGKNNNKESVALGALSSPTAMSRASG